jgi:GT2 family glycosyltransferase
VWQSVGLFDEGYRFYYEDHDLSLRARAGDWRILHEPQARATHRVSASTGSGTPDNAYLLARSSVRFYLQHTSGFHRAFIVVYRLGSLARTLIESVVARRPRSGWAYVVGLSHGVGDALGSGPSFISWSDK